MIKPYIKNETAVDIICSICDRMYPGMDCEPADCDWMKMLAEEAVDAVPVVRCRDCQWVDKPECCPLHLSDLTEGGEALPHRADFCSYGERKESRH